MCGRLSEFLGGRMPQPDQTQDSAGILQGKCMCKKVKGKYDAPSTQVATNDNKRISNEHKMVAAAKSSSSSTNNTRNKKDFSCSSCPRKFSSQQALAGHRNTHRSEWESLFDIPDHGKIDQCQKLPGHSKPSPLSNPTIALKCQLFGNSSSILRNASSTIHKPTFCAPQYPSGNPKNILEGTSTKAPRYSLTNPTNTSEQPLTCVRQCPLVKPTNTLIEPSPKYPLANPKNTPKGPSPRYPLASPTNTLKGPSPRSSLASPTYTLKMRSPRYPLANPTNTLKGSSHKCTLANPTNTHKGPLPRHSLPTHTTTLKGTSPRYHLANPTDTFKEPSHGYPLANPTNTLKGLSPPPSIVANPTNTLLGQSLISHHQSFFGSTKTLNMPSIRDPKDPLNNCAKPHGKLALGVRYESMIHKPCRCRWLGQTDMLSRDEPSLFGRKQMTGGNVRCFGTNGCNLDLRSLLAAAGSISSFMFESGGSSKAHDFVSSSFQSRGGKGIRVHDLFPLTPAQERHNHDMDQSSQGIVPQSDQNGEDVDLDLKL